MKFLSALLLCVSVLVGRAQVDFRKETIYFLMTTSFF